MRGSPASARVTSGMSIDRAALAAGELRDDVVDLQQDRRGDRGRRQRDRQHAPRSARAAARRARGAGRRFTPGRPRRPAARPALGGEALGHAAREVDQRAAVDARASRSRPTRPGRGGRRRTGRTRRPARPAFRNATASDAPSRPTLIDSPSVSREAAWQSASTYGFVRRHARGRPDERARDVDVRDRPDLGEQLARVLLGEVADVDVHGAFLGHLVRRVAADDPARGSPTGGRRAPRTQG